jgi:hypothetical protein
MSAQSNSANKYSDMNALFKEVYADKVKELIPDGVKILNLIDFMSKDKQPGNSYHQPVVLGLEHGITFASSDEDAFNLRPAISGVIKDATIKGNSAVLRGLIGITAVSRSQGSKQAFMDATKYIVGNMLRSMTKKLEAEMLYGQMGYATVASVSGATVTITTAEWAPGLWAGAEKLPIEVRDTTDATSRGETKVQSVDMDARTVTFESVVPGLVAGDVLWHGGAHGNEFPGIHKILTQSSGTLFGISVSQYNLFKGNSYAVSGALSFAKVVSAAARPVEKGQEGRLICFVNPRGWANMNNDQAALRMYDQSYSPEKSKNGSRSLVFYSQNGEIEIQPSIYIKEGYAYLLDLSEWARVGSSDITFKRPGQGEQFFKDSENAAAYELRLYTDQALFCAAPGKNCILTGIVNS